MRRGSQPRRMQVAGRRGNVFAQIFGPLWSPPKRAGAPPGKARRIRPPRLRRNAHRCVFFARRQGTSVPGPCPSGSRTARGCGVRGGGEVIGIVVPGYHHTLCLWAALVHRV